MVDEVGRTLEATILEPNEGPEAFWRTVVHISTVDYRFMLTQTTMRVADESLEIDTTIVENVDLQFESREPLEKIHSLVEQHLENSSMSHSIVVDPSSVAIMTDRHGEMDRYEREGLEATISLSQRVFEVSLEENTLFEKPVIPVVPLGTEMTDYKTMNSKNLIALQEILSEALETANGDSQIPISDEALTQRCLPRYQQGDYAGAAREAGQILEERVDTMSSLEEKHGVDMFNQVLSPNGEGIEVSSDGGEQTGVMMLFSGFYQAIRNPLSHRRPDPDMDRFLDELGQEQAHHILCFADFLLSLIDSSEQ